MDHEIVLKHRLVNIVQSIALVTLLALLLAYLAYIIAGETLAWFSIIMVIVLFFSNPVITPRLILRMYNARPITYNQAPGLFEVVGDLANRAGLNSPPHLYYIPSHVINAFTMGTRSDSVIAISDGVLRRLTMKELSAIIAHEITHIRHNDIRVMTFADIAGRVTKSLSMIGQLLIFINLPLILLTEVQISWWPLLVLLVAPLVSDLIQLGLSRVREYEADIGSAILLGDARPLASALTKVESYAHNYFGSIFIPIRKIPEPSLLRTHPPTEERVRRLLEFHNHSQSHPIYPNTAEDTIDHSPFMQSTKIPNHPKRHYNGFWY